MARRSRAARRYAEAAFELAERDAAFDAWASGLGVAAAGVSDPRVGTFLDSPAVPLPDRLGVMERMLAGRAPDGVVRLAKLLVRRRVADRLAPIATEFQRLLNDRRGIVEALVTSAAALTPEETTALRTKIEQMTHRTVTLRVQVDVALIGGLTVRVGDTLYDASVRGRLERLRAQLIAAR